MKKKLINIMYKNPETGGDCIDSCDADISSLKKIDPKKLAGKINPNELKKFDKYFKDNDEDNTSTTPGEKDGGIDNPDISTNPTETDKGTTETNDGTTNVVGTNTSQTLNIDNTSTNRKEVDGIELGSWDNLSFKEANNQFLRIHDIQKLETLKKSGIMDKYPIGYYWLGVRYEEKGSYKDAVDAFADGLIKIGNGKGKYRILQKMAKAEKELPYVNNGMDIIKKSNKLNKIFEDGSKERRKGNPYAALDIYINGLKEIDNPNERRVLYRLMQTLYHRIESKSSSLMFDIVDIISNLTIPLNELNNVNGKFANELAGDLSFDVNMHDSNYSMFNDTISISFDIDDRFINEDYNKNITLLIPRDKIFGLKKEEKQGKIRNFIINTIVPKISQLSTKSEQEQKNPNNKVFKFS